MSTVETASGTGKITVQLVEGDRSAFVEVDAPPARMSPAVATSYAGHLIEAAMRVERKVAASTSLPWPGAFGLPGDVQHAGEGI